MIYQLIALVALALYRPYQVRHCRVIVRDLWSRRWENEAAHHQQWLPNHRQIHQHIGKLARV